ncbi:MAG: hypothetical protein K2J60_04265 [Acetatifactor sp.]|nr:hypothetical protein [Acetatifactor sp.]
MDKKNFMLRLFIVLFTISVSTTIMPCGIVNIHGLFGELKQSVVTEEHKALIEEIEKQVFAKESRIKGINIFNAGLYIVIIILCLIFLLYTKSLPPENTIVTFKVRMNN